MRHLALAALLLLYCEPSVLFAANHLHPAPLRKVISRDAGQRFVPPPVHRSLQKVRIPVRPAQLMRPVSLARSQLGGPALPEGRNGAWLTGNPVRRRAAIP